MNGLNRRIDPQAGVKILGERNSGTNFLENLLRENLPDLRLFDNIRTLPTPESAAYPQGFFPRWERYAAEEALLDHYHITTLAEAGGWKHAAPTDRLLKDFLIPTGAAVVILLRHPAAWLRSMHRNPFHTVCHVPGDISEFLRQPWLTMARDELPERLLPDLASLLAQKITRYQWLLDLWPNSTVIRYEDLASAPATTLAAIGLSLGDAPRVPETDSRWFARTAPPKGTYRAQAAAASYTVLNDADQRFLRAGLAATALDLLYPD